jgi:MFS transporter, Spinster family, sphingosine-1-phosphate transporter
VSASRHRWSVVAIFFMFMLIHQADKLVIGSLAPDIMDTFKITKTQMGLVTTGALIVGAVFYPIWGYLYDRFARPKLLALASLIWGATTWLNAIAPTYPIFLGTRATTGVDDSSYPGLYSLISDYFGPLVRGKIYGLLQLTAPIGYLGGMIFAMTMSGTLGWRGIFYITGSIGLVLAVVIFFAVRDVPRGRVEPELAGVQDLTTYRFSWQTARELFKKRSLLLLFVQGFFGVFPWTTITYWIITYLQEERGYSDAAVQLTMTLAIVVLALGYPLGGAAGDWLFKRTPRGRAIVAAIAVLTGAVLLYFTLNIPVANQGLFMVMLAVTALFIPFAGPNVVSIVYDITLPEVRSTAMSIQYFIESAGAALAPTIAGAIADAKGSSLRIAFLVICIATWVLCAIFFAFVAKLVPGDIATLHDQLQARAAYEQARQP